MWKQIPVSDGQYWINESGQIYNSVRKAYLHPSVFSNGYYVVSLPITPGHPKKFLLHRLVAEAFLPNPDNLPVVMHLDNNPLNCHVSNLKWATYSENNASAIRDGLNVVPRPDNRKIILSMRKPALLWLIAMVSNRLLEKSGLALIYASETTFLGRVVFP